VEQAVKTRGFSMIEILVALAIVGILVTLAAPGIYSNLVRDQVVEAAALIDTAKKHVGAVWAGGGTMPASNAEAGLPAPSKMVGNTVVSLSVDNGIITVTFGNKASTVLTGKVLTIRPAVVDDSPVVPIAWVCGNARAPDGMTARGTNQTDLPSYALPVNCR